MEHLPENVLLHPTRSSREAGSLCSLCTHSRLGCSCQEGSTCRQPINLLVLRNPVSVSVWATLDWGMLPPGSISPLNRDEAFVQSDYTLLTWNATEALSDYSRVPLLGSCLPTQAPTQLSRRVNSTEKILKGIQAPKANRTILLIP